MFRIGRSTSSAVVDEELFRKYAEGGIEWMEVSLTKAACLEQDHTLFARWAKEYNVNLWSYHLPFGIGRGLDISLDRLQKDTIEMFSELIKKAASIGIEKMIMHPSGEPIAEEERPERIKRAQESLSILAPVAASCGAVICVEELPRTCLGRNSSDMLALLSADERLRSCFDTNHLLNEDPLEYIAKVGSKIVTTHVSDYDFVDERHWLPGVGQIYWYALSDALKNVGFDGVWMYELGFENTKKITRERLLTCEDYVRNAKEIFAKAPITLIPHEKHV